MCAQADCRSIAAGMGTCFISTDLRCRVEKDALGWSKSRLAALLGDVQLASEGSFTLRTAGLGKVEGEAIGKAALHEQPPPCCCLADSARRGLSRAKLGTKCSGGGSERRG